MSGLESWLPRQPSHSFRGSLLLIWKVAKQSKGPSTRGSWTLAPIYRLEAGVIKQPPSGIQMRNLVCNPRTQQNDNVCFLVILRPDQSFDPLWGTVSADGGSFIRLWPNVDTKQRRFSLSFWEDVDFPNRTQTLAHQTEQNWIKRLLMFDGGSVDVRGFYLRRHWYERENSPKYSHLFIVWNARWNILFLKLD